MTAILSVALVVLLNVLAVSPELHAWIHGHHFLIGGSRIDGDDHLTSPTPGDSGHHSRPCHPEGADHECAVTIFASGVILSVFFVRLMLARRFAYSIIGRDAGRLIVARPHYWHVPSHAPPLV